MVKRAKTPEANEEDKYYTCWSPYPNNADFELSEHYITFCRWIANVLGDSNPLHSLYYKPRHGMIIFAVDKTYRFPERLLGEHRWSEFLKKPGNSERTLVSKVFYSTYNTDREVQKDGWKYIAVEDFFFLNWGIDKWFTKVPYPAPHWCDVPSENRVHKALCRPLPGAQVPRPGSSVPTPRQVPGSADWTQTKTSAATNFQRATPKGRGNPASTGTGAKANKQTTTKPTWGQDSFPALDSKASAPKIIPGLPTQTTPTVQSAWGNRPSKSAPAPSPRRSALAPPENSTAHNVWTKNKSSAPQPAASSSTAANSTSGSENPPPAKPQNAKGKDEMKPSPVVTTANTKKGKNASSHPRKSKYSSSGSSCSQSDHSNTASPPSSAPSSPSFSAASLASGSVSGTVQIDPSEYDNDYDYDEELTEETYHEDWETASVYVPNETDTIAVRIGSNDKGKGKSVPPVMTSKTKMKTGTSNLWPEDNPHPSLSSPPVNLWAKPEPVKQEPMINLWADPTPNFRPTGRASAVEARAKTGEEILCPYHKGKCPRGVCEEYKKEKKRIEKLQRKKENQKLKAEEEEEEKKKEEGGSREKKETKHEAKKVDQERPADEKKGPKKKANEEEKESKEKKRADDGEKMGSKEPKKKVKEETPVEDTVVTPTPSPPPSNDQDNKKMWADYDVDGDSDIGDIPDFDFHGKRFYDDEDFELHED